MHLCYGPVLTDRLTVGRKKFVVNSGVFRIPKRRAKRWLATSAHTKGAKPSFPIFLLCKKNFFAKGRVMADLAKE